MHTKAEQDKANIQQCIYIFFVFVWCLRAWQGLLLYQLQEAPFISVEADNTFWLWHALQLPYFAIQYPLWAGFLDALWLILASYGLYRTSQKKNNRFVGAAIALVFFNYFIVYNTVATHHEHTLVPLLMLSLLLFVDEIKSFTLLFVGMRYYAIFVMVSAALWKFWRGSLFQPNQMSEILKRQHLDYLISYPDAYFSNFITYLIEHPAQSNVFWYSGWIVEFIFILGCFSLKYDKLLGILMLAFFLMDFLIMRLGFHEFCIFVLVFYPWKGLWLYYQSNFKAHQ